MSIADVPTNPLRRPPVAVPSSAEGDPPLEPTRILGWSIPLEGHAPTLPGFRFLEVLGRGGMGTVYKALDISLDRLVAVKVVLGEGWLDPSARVRFAMEAEAVAAVNHPNVLPVHSFGEHEGRPYLVMEFAEGGSLSNWLKQHGRLPPRDAAHLMEGVARGVHAAHQAGIVHRDLKPANILLADTSKDVLTPKVADFGLAKRVGSLDGLTNTGAVLGTPGYMAPEQAAGGGKAVGPAADIYALGVLLYFSLTGQLPHDGDEPSEILLKTLQEDPPSVRQLAPGTPQDLDQICLKCLARKPGDRYPTAAALADDLQHFLNGEPVSVRPPGPLERVARWCRRHPARSTAIGLGGLAIVLAGFAILSMDWLHQAEQSLTQAAIERQKELDQRQAAETERDNTLGAYRHQSLDLAYRDYEAGRVSAARAILDSCPEAARGLEWKLLDRLISRDLKEYRSSTGAIHGLRSQDPHHQVSLVDRSGLRIWDPTATTEPPLTYRVATAGCALGATRHVIFDEQEQIHVLDAFTHQPIRTFASGGHFTAGSIDATGTRLLAYAANSGAALFDLATGVRLHSYTFQGAFITCGAFSPDDRWIALAGREESPGSNSVAVGTVKLYAADASEPVRVILTRTDTVEAMAFAPNSKRLVTASRDGSLKLWELDSGTLVNSYRVPVGSASSVAFAPDGDHFASGGREEPTVRVWNTMTGREERTLRAHTSAVKHVGFNRDGTRLASADTAGTLKLWDLTQPPDALQLQGMPPHPVTAAVSNDGQSLFTSDGTSGVKAWNLRTGAMRWTWPTIDQVRFVQLSADGTELLIGTRLGLVLGRAAATGQVLNVALPQTLPTPPAGLTGNRAQVLVRSHNGEVTLVSMTTGEVKATMPGRHPGPPARTCVSADGSMVAVLGEDGTLKLWDTARHEVRSVPATTGKWLAFTLSPDGQRLATTSDDGRLRLWSTSEIKERLAFRPRSEPIAALAFSPDGTRLAAVGDHGGVELYDAGKPR